MNSFPDRTALEAWQSRRLFDLLRHLQRDNPFYRRKLAGGSTAGPPDVAGLARLPFTTKAELAEDQRSHAPWGTNLTFPLQAYVRLHQTSGTTGQPLLWLDTRESWQWFLDCWRAVYRAAGLRPGDRVFFAFSFGPFIGFWAAFEAAQQLGALAMTGGALSTEQRLDHLLHRRASVLVSTPTYGLHLAEVARAKGLDLARSDVRLNLHAGEPGASVPNTRRRLEAAWGSRVVDHAGATEVGAWGLPGDEPDCLLLHEPEFIAEVIDPETLAPVQPDAEGVRRGELVLTNLGRLGSPVIRYLTGDLVALEREGTGQPPLARLRGGVLGRIDDMVVVRGVNVYPAALENIVRGHPEIDEFEILVDRRRELTELGLRIEARGDGESVRRRLARDLHDRLALRIEVELAESGSLPRWELKARRVRAL